MRGLVRYIKKTAPVRQYRDRLRTTSARTDIIHTTQVNYIISPVEIQAPGIFMPILRGG